MPYKNPEDKKAWKARWKERTKDSGYNKWLYERRKLRFENAEAFRLALEQIARDGDPEGAIALEALADAAVRERRVGLPPSTVGPVQGMSLADALGQLGLRDPSETSV